MGTSLLALAKSIYDENDYYYFLFFLVILSFLFHKRGFALSLVLKARVSRTRKLPFAFVDFQTDSLLSGCRSTCILLKKKKLAKNNA